MQIDFNDSPKKYTHTHAMVYSTVLNRMYELFGEIEISFCVAD